MLNHKNKMPIYDKSNLIDFKRKNLWMHSVEKHGHAGVNLAIGVCALAIAFIFVIGKIWGLW